MNVDRMLARLRLVHEMRKVFDWAHRWFGLIAGFYFVLLGLTGSYLVYDDAIDRFFKPERHHVTPSANSVSLAELVRVAQTQLQTDKTPFMIRVSGERAQTARVVIDAAKPGEDRKMTATFIDPGSLQVRGTEVSSQTFTGFMFAFHHDLFWGGTGRTIMGGAGILMCLILVTGLLLWWPRNRSIFSALKTRKWRNALQMNLELHKVTGIWTLILMIVVTATGTYISKPNWFMPQPSQTEQPKEGKPRSGSNQKPPEFDWIAIQNSMEADYGKDLRPLFVRVRGPNAMVMAWPGGKEIRRMYAADGTLKPEEKRDSFAGDVRAINHDLHVGHFWGWFGEFLIFISGLLPLFFYVTGVIVWWKKSQLKKSSSTAPRPQGALL